LVVFGPTLGEIITIIALYIYLILGGVGIILLAKEKTDARLIRLAYYDSSTGTLNRDGFIDAMTTAIEKSSYDNEAFAMLLVDIDGLNEINELHGYVAGDRIIADTVEKLGAAVGDKGFIGRLSGDEFMIFLRGVDRQGLDDFSAALRASVIGNPCDGIAYTISIGGGAYEYPAGRDIQFPMVHAACADALKTAKKKGYDNTVMALT
ncbi:MAG: GGDEF domain-containing protein, partial [Spirochaetales bacterium]